MYRELAKKVNLVSGLVSKVICGLVSKADYDAKINKIKSEIFSISGLAATAALNYQRNK